MVGIIIGVIILALVVAAIVVGIQQGWFKQAGTETAAPEAGTLDAARPRPPVAEFHVRGTDALVYFDVPLPAGPTDEVLRDLLLHEAVEVVREKRHDLPIAQVTKVVAHGKHDGEPVAVGEVRLETPGELPPPVMPEHIAHASRVNLDLSSALASSPAAQPGVAAPSREKRLGPVGAELRLTGGLEAGLRAQGLDPAEMSAGDLVVAILRMTGQTVSAGPSADTVYATRGGERTLVRIVDHLPDSNPELSERDINRFMVDFGSSGASRGLLVTDKYSPFMVYERERREKRVRFLSRERLQHFVDAVAVS